MVETIEIPVKEYEQLKKESKWLSFLEAAGVDNWEGYDYALEMQEEDEATETPPTLGIHVEEDIKTADIFGRR